jgi:hypothetical protein
MAISSFVDEASEAKDQISTSMKAMSLWQCIFKMKQSLL